MQATVELGEKLLSAAKKEAERQSLSLDKYIEKALRKELGRVLRQEPEVPFRLVTFGSSGVQPGVKLANLTALLGADDVPVTPMSVDETSSASDTIVPPYFEADPALSAPPSEATATVSISDSLFGKEI